MRNSSQPRQSGYVLIAVIGFLLIAGAVSLLLVEEGGIGRALTASQAERNELHYVTEAALEHATWRLQQTTSCSAYLDLPSTSFGNNSYSASVTPTNGSPITITATGVLANGLSRTITRSDVSSYGVPLTLVLQPGSEGKDTFIEGESGHQAHNKDDDKDIKTNGKEGKEYHGLLQFDLASIPTGSTIRSAMLELYLNKGSSSPDTIGVHRITNEWTESGATWIERRNGDSWDTAGGDYDGMQAASFEVASVGWYSVDISTLAQAWLNGTYPNHGLMLVPEPTQGNDSNEFTSSDDGDDTLHPKLTIVYACECGLSCAGPSFGPIAHWELDDASGSTAIDSAGDSDGSLAGNPTWSDGVVGGGLDFDGSGDRVDAGAILSEGTPEITIAAWVYKRDGGDDRVVSKSTGTSVVDHVYSLGVANTTIRVRLKTEDNGGTADYDGGNIALDEWTHLAFTYDGSELKIFRNGTQTATYAVTGDVVSSTIATSIGNVNDSDNRYWNGVLDDVRIYNRALTASEVAELGDYLAVSSTAHWKLDDGGGATALDSVGPNDGTLTNGPVWSEAGMRGGALEFDGVDDYIDVPHDDGLSITSALTITAWVYNTSPSFAGTHRIVSKEASGSNNNYSLSLSAQTLWLGVGGSFLSSSATLSTDAWHHVAGSFDDNTNTVRLYVDGVETDQHFTGTTITPNTSPLRVGANWESGKYFHGLLDDVRIYDRALTADEVAELADTLTGTSAAHWPLDDGSGTTAVDVVGPHDGTLQGGPAWSTGQLDGGLEFDGADDYIDVGAFDVTGSGLTLSGWFNADNLTNEGRVISKANGVADADAWWQLSIRDKDSAQWLRMRVKAGGTTTAYTDSTVKLETGEWYFAAGTYDNDTAEMKLFLNGTQLGTQSHAVGGPIDADPTVPVWIGANGSSERHFDGTLDDVRVYNRALTAAEISSLAGPTSLGPTAHWPFNETSGSIAEDIAGGHDGTLNGLPLWESGALRFGGSSDYVSVPHDNALSLTNSMTFTARFYAPSFGSGYRTLISKDDGGSNSNYWVGTNARELEFGFWAGGSFSSISTGGLNLSPHTWYNVAASYDATADKAALYVNGVEAASGSIGAAPTAVSANPEIGRSADGEYWLGYIDDLRIYNQFLSPDVISSLSGASVDGGSCIGNYLDQFNAESFSGNDGTLTWSGPWQEVGESNGADSGDIRMRDDDSEYQLQIRDNDNGGEGVQRVADLSSMTRATLSLDYRRDGLDNTNDYVTLSVSSNGLSGPWTEIDRYSGRGSDSRYQSVNYDISSFASSNTAIRLLSSASLGSNDEVYFDNIEITCAP